MRQNPSVNNNLLYNVMAVVDCNRELLRDRLSRLDARISQRRSGVVQQLAKDGTRNSGNFVQSAACISSELGEHTRTSLSSTSKETDESSAPICTCSADVGGISASASHPFCLCSTSSSVSNGSVPTADLNVTSPNLPTKDGVTSASATNEDVTVPMTNLEIKSASMNTDMLLKASAASKDDAMTSANDDVMTSASKYDVMTSANKDNAMTSAASNDDAMMSAKDDALTSPTTNLNVESPSAATNGTSSLTPTTASASDVVVTSALPSTSNQNDSEAVSSSVTTNDVKTTSPTEQNLTSPPIDLYRPTSLSKSAAGSKTEDSARCTDETNSADEDDRRKVLSEMRPSVEQYREYVRDSMRRRHNYRPFITRFLQLLHEHRLLDDVQEPKRKSKKLTTSDE